MLKYEGSWFKAHLRGPTSWGCRGASRRQRRPAPDCGRGHPVGAKVKLMGMGWDLQGSNSQWADPGGEGGRKGVG